MHLARVDKWGEAPEYIEAPAPAAPSPDSNEVHIKVLATGLHRLVRSRADGTHFSAKGPPHVPGVDGVGTTPDGKTVYFSTFANGALGGSYCDVVNVSKAALTPVPDGADNVQIAAYVNPGMASFMAIKTRTENLPPNFTVLILGATTASGTVAISLVRQLGAGKVIGAARNAQALATLGLDGSVVLKDVATETDYSQVGPVDVILDFLYGPHAAHILKTINVSRPLQYVQIGTMAALEISLPGELLRSKNITLRGAAPGSYSLAEMAREIPLLIGALKAIEPHKVRVVPLSQIESVWGEKEKERVVFVP